MTTVLVLTGRCPDCGCDLVVRKRKKDGERFVACSGFPSCRWACSYDQAELAEQIMGTVNRNKNDKEIDVKKIRRALALEFHPDRCSGTLSPTVITQRIFGILERF